MKANVFFLACLAFLFLNCKQQPLEITGEYSFEVDGLPNYIVSKTNDKYTLKFKTTSGKWTDSKEFIPVDEYTIQDIFGKEKSEWILYGYVWKSEECKTGFRKRQNKIYIFNVIENNDSELFSSGFVYRYENGLTNITERLYKL